MKILKNTTANPIFVEDTGITIPANSSYEIYPADDTIWAASSNVIPYVGTGALVGNDGTYDLTQSQTMQMLQGLFPSKIMIAGSNTNVTVGNIEEWLKVVAKFYPGDPTGVSTVFYQNELSITTRNETDIANTIYTVGTNKNFLLTNIIVTSDAVQGVVVRLRMQVGGTGNWIQKMKIFVKAQQQEDSTIPISFGDGIKLATARDVLKLTAESTLAKGVVWGMYSGKEY